MTKTIYADEYKKISGNLKKARQEIGLTQTEAAKKLNRPQSYVSKAENGEQRLDILELKKFAKLYNKKIEFFI